MVGFDNSYGSDRLRLWLRAMVGVCVERPVEIQQTVRVSYATASSRHCVTKRPRRRLHSGATNTLTSNQATRQKYVERAGEDDSSYILARNWVGPPRESFLRLSLN